MLNENISFVVSLTSPSACNINVKMWNFTPVIKIIVAFIKNIPTSTIADITYSKGIRTSLCSRHLALPLPKCFLHHFFRLASSRLTCLNLHSLKRQRAAAVTGEMDSVHSSQFSAIRLPFSPCELQRGGRGSGVGSCQLKRLLGCGAIISFQLCKLNLKTFNVTSHAPHKELSCRWVRMRMRMRMPMRMRVRMCEREGKAKGGWICLPCRTLVARMFDYLLEKLPSLRSCVCRPSYSSSSCCCCCSLGDLFHV